MVTLISFLSFLSLYFSIYLSSLLLFQMELNFFYEISWVPFIIHYSITGTVPSWPKYSDSIMLGVRVPTQEFGGRHKCLVHCSSLSILASFKEIKTGNNTRQLLRIASKIHKFQSKEKITHGSFVLIQSAVPQFNSVTTTTTTTIIMIIITSQVLCWEPGYKCKQGAAETPEKPTLANSSGHVSPLDFL